MFEIKIRETDKDLLYGIMEIAGIVAYLFVVCCLV